MTIIREPSMHIKRVFRPHTALALCAVAAVLVACGGGDSAAPAAAMPTQPSSASVPPQASTSVSALIAWASQLPKEEATEPLSTDAFQPPVDDGAEPTTVH